MSTTAVSSNEAREEMSPEQRFPELFNQTDIEPKTRKRTVPMKLLVIGMCRTGTVSMLTALKELGFHHTYHMIAVIKNPRDSDIWRKAELVKFHGKGKKLTREDWDQVLGDSDACIDLPSAAYMPELIEAYPEAKVLISERDPDKWYKSMYNTVGRASEKPDLIFLLLMLLDGWFIRRWAVMIFGLTESVFGKNAILKNPEHVKEVYSAMHDEVRQLVPVEKRLEYQLGDGWEPLCKFLDKEVPNTPFPHVNDTKDFQARMEQMKVNVAKRLAKAALPYAAVVLAGVAAWSMGYIRR